MAGTHSWSSWLEQCDTGSSLPLLVLPDALLPPKHSLLPSPIQSVSLTFFKEGGKCWGGRVERESEGDLVLELPSRPASAVAWCVTAVVEKPRRWVLGVSSFHSHLQSIDPSTTDGLHSVLGGWPPHPVGRPDAGRFSLRDPNVFPTRETKARKKEESENAEDGLGVSESESEVGEVGERR